MGIITIIFIGLLFFYIAYRKRNGKQIKKVSSTLEIHKVNSIQDIVMSVNHGRIYPFFTRMNFVRAKSAAEKVTANITEFEQSMQMYELMGMTPYLNLSVSNNYIDRVSVTLNKQNLVSSIGIDIKNFEVNMKPLVEEMVIKFGRPTSMDNEFIIWREGFMVINIHKEGSLSVIDESIFGR